MGEVKIEVLGGVAYVVSKPSNITVEIKDLDIPKGEVGRLTTWGEGDTLEPITII